MSKDASTVEAPSPVAATSPSSRTLLAVRDDHCSVARTGEIVGLKWTLVIVHDLSEGPRRFSELEHACPGISPRTLSERLHTLEREGIVVRHDHQQHPPRVDYQLTDKGRALLPITAEMRRFGHNWLCARRPQGGNP
jgi:DNA-binding HxlR family transcriptional regulator